MYCISGSYELHDGVRETSRTLLLVLFSCCLFYKILFYHCCLFCFCKILFCASVPTHVFELVILDSYIYNDGNYAVERVVGIVDPYILMYYFEGFVHRGM